MKDEHGMPLPGDASPLPWSRNNERDLQADERRIDDYDGVRVAGVWDDDDCEFIVHAANHIIPCRDIVRRLAEWIKSDLVSDFDEIALDAVKLWDEMQREKGGGDE